METDTLLKIILAYFTIFGILAGIYGVFTIYDELTCENWEQTKVFRNDCYKGYCNGVDQETGQFYDIKRTCTMRGGKAI